MSVDLVEVVRSGFRECVHRGSVVILRPDGEPDLELGAVHTPIYPRSSNKPMQALTLLRNGFEPVDGEELAITTASHEGERLHVQLVKRLLDQHGLTEEQLLCPPDLPGNEFARAAVISGGGARSRRIYMNCSGKHAAMLATCRINDWPTANYLDPAHPLQLAVLDTIAELTGEPETDLGIDGCGLPIVPVSLVNLARAYARFVTAEPDSPERRLADVVREHPFVVSGTEKDDLTLMTTVPGLFTKAGADGVHVGALPDGSAFAFKIDDGSERPRLPLAAAILQRIGAGDNDDLIDSAAQPVLGGGARVGTVRAIPGLF